ncbi:PREDICTED: uncharacterized protein LOC109180422 [Ipomoea nil]|uniref:uncharacterized protein LOC109180422 n=1 Tax=Ipomoea nil TaxID=35883 RepID=UPI0009015312|nr:PREDICTED: uncharacterized protein LOC109180422 [Ipomoea nil]XP_019185525.1 PREDICTED: uncharacterized protein LOC109180422 [Ipomoea nil]
MYSQNTEQKSFGAPTSPRISFSNNLVEFIANGNNARSSSHHNLQMIKNERYAAAPVSSDFEFSVANSSLMSGADELFSNGRLLPFKQAAAYSGNHHGRKNTLRDELLAQDEDDDEEEGDFSLRPPKSSNKWKGLLGLRKSHIGSKKVDKNEEKTDEIHGSKTSQETLHGGGASIGFKGRI